MWPSGGQGLLVQVHGAVHLRGHRCWGRNGHRRASDPGVQKCGARAPHGTPSARGEK